MEFNKYRLLRKYSKLSGIPFKLVKYQAMLEKMSLEEIKKEINALTHKTE